MSESLLASLWKTDTRPLMQAFKRFIESAISRETTWAERVVLYEAFEAGWMARPD